jgi:flagellar FliL protein
MSLSKLTLTLCKLCLVSCLSLGLTALPANANEKAASAQAGNVAKLEPFTVNLAGFERYLQTTISLQVQSPEISAKIKEWMPKVRHEMIMILSSKESSEIQSLQGKQELISKIKETINQALKAKEHDGVSDVFFETFVIQ